MMRAGGGGGFGVAVTWVPQAQEAWLQDVMYMDDPWGCCAALCIILSRCYLFRASRALRSVREKGCCFYLGFQDPPDSVLIQSARMRRGGV
jgi:hypothetical protein